MSNLYSVGQMNQLADALEKAGFTADEVTKLRKSNLGAFKAVLNGSNEIKSIENIIDCDADPSIPYNGWRVEEHNKMGMFKLEQRGVDLYLGDKKIDLYLSGQQKKGRWIKGHELRKDLADKAMLNANVLDYLLAHPNLIPKEWKGKAIFFWGTIYRGSAGSLCVRFLCFDGGGWVSDRSWLDNDWSGSDPAAVRAS